MRVIPLGDLLVFPDARPDVWSADYWRGSPDSTLQPGEYFTDSGQVALWYARRAGQGAYVSGYYARAFSRSILDAWSNPIRTLVRASGVPMMDPTLDEAWEAMEQTPGMVRALHRAGYDRVMFEDVAPSRGVTSFKYVGTRPLPSQPVVRVATPGDARKIVPAGCASLWDDPQALPATLTGLHALTAARDDFGLDPDFLEEPDAYLGGAQEHYGWDDVVSLLADEAP